MSSKSMGNQLGPLKVLELTKLVVINDESIL